MEKKTLSELERKYDLEIDRIVKEIKENKSKKVLLQFPDGMKPYSDIINRTIEEKTGCETFIWMESCFGGCDIPIDTERLGIDLIVQFGHSNWNYKKDIEVL